MLLQAICEALEQLTCLGAAVGSNPGQRARLGAGTVSALQSVRPWSS